ncbi:MAG TPA: FAD-dependent oxidoreductase [Haliscomenobacter sp.]|uniref:NAD(P)/FAD-dependent oxidoreductase n=1 Tax=Haliscomenobacter sp. TaxID=2717303 RepID=UPI002CD4182A|nr:FAD-dependent oxidoreductase [Haliscomenobacter sp.]HOY20975.1 FAD-dependent oxidoreductase [Haliscomenobacter sp.]
MNLHTANPYWLLKSGLLFEYPSLQQNLKTDYAIIGGGITGALIAWYLSRAGVSVVLLDRRHIGMGSTCASTSMLQYEIDTPMYQLAEIVGEDNAARSYWLCAEAINKLEIICNQLAVATDFEKKPSLYYASRKADLPGLKTELTIRQKHGFVVEFLDQADLQALFPFAAPGALYSKEGAQVDAYTLTHGLLQDAIGQGAGIFDKTTVTAINRNKNGVILETKEGHSVRARKLVIATGYESGQWLPRQIAALHSSYALVSEPYAAETLWHENALVWETARPYLYFRTTADRRVLIGGRDEPFQDAKRRDRLLKRKSQQLTRDFEKLFPHLAPLKVDYHWAGTFAETVDGLPYIGSIPEQAHTIYALGFGGNGVTFSQIAAELIRDEALGNENPDANIFSFNR